MCRSRDSAHPESFLAAPFFFFFCICCFFFSPVIYISCVFWKHFENMFRHNPFPPRSVVWIVHTMLSLCFALPVFATWASRPALRFRDWRFGDSQKRCDEGHKIDGEQQSPCHREGFSVTAADGSRRSAGVNVTWATWGFLTSSSEPGSYPKRAALLK